MREGTKLYSLWPPTEYGKQVCFLLCSLPTPLAPRISKKCLAYISWFSWEPDVYLGLHFSLENAKTSFQLHPPFPSRVRIMQGESLVLKSNRKRFCFWRLGKSCQRAKASSLKRKCETGWVSCLIIQEPNCANKKLERIIRYTYILLFLTAC